MRTSSRRLLIEAGVGTAIVVVALAARYGARGLLAAVPVAWGGLALLAVPWRAAPSQALSALATPVELGALAAAIVVSWIASVHERRSDDLEEQHRLMVKRAGQEAVTLGELRRAALSLRARNDRLDLALT